MERFKDLISDIIRNSFILFEPFPEFGGCGEFIYLFFDVGDIIILDNTMAICRIDKLQIENLSVILGLLKTVFTGFL